jgi:hypothetical protein
MYRDDAIDLDEHDRAVGAILIGEALIAQCDAKSYLAKDDPKRWRAMRDLHDDYPEVWRQLDRAKRILEKRGANTMGYEELRTHVKPSVVVSGKDDDQSVDHDALDDARRAIGELKLAVPGTDWKGITKRTNDLAATPRLRKRHNFVASLIVSGFMLGIAGWFFAIVPEKKVDQREVMRQEIADVAAQRVQRIERLGLVINNICDPNTAHEYIKLLVLDGQKDAAVAFSEDYKGRCGDDRVVENWAKAPRAKPRTSISSWALPTASR